MTTFAPILVPAALENQITAENVGKVAPRVRIVAEGANGPMRPEAEQVLQTQAPPFADIAIERSDPVMPAPT